MQRQREARILEKKEARKKERAIKRRQEYARRCRIQIEERRLKVAINPKPYKPYISSLWFLSPRLLSLCNCVVCPNPKLRYSE